MNPHCKHNKFIKGLMNSIRVYFKKSIILKYQTLFMFYHSNFPLKNVCFYIFFINICYNLTSNNLLDS